MNKTNKNINKSANCLFKLANYGFCNTKSYLFNSQSIYFAMVETLPSNPQPLSVYKLSSQPEETY